MLPHIISTASSNTYNQDVTPENLFTILKLLQFNLRKFLPPIRRYRHVQQIA